MVERDEKGRIKPGASLNPGGAGAGRAKSAATIARSILAKTGNGDEVIEFLLTTMRDTKAALNVRYQCARELLDRSAGKATQTLDVRIDGEEKPETPSIDDWLEKLSPEGRAALDVLIAPSPSPTEH